jgi:hypothetical protein
LQISGSSVDEVLINWILGSSTTDGESNRANLRAEN